jgi:hypothetical protein
MDRVRVAHPFKDVGDARLRKLRPTFGEQEGRLVLIAREPAQAPDVFHERKVTHKAEPDLFERPREDVRVRPAVEGDDQGIVFQHTEDFRKRRPNPRRVAVADDRLFLPVPSSSVAELAQNGKLTPKALTEMKQRMPYADLNGFEANPEVDRLLELYTVDMLLQYVSCKL